VGLTAASLEVQVLGGHSQAVGILAPVCTATEAMTPSFGSHVKSRIVWVHFMRVGIPQRDGQQRDSGTNALNWGFVPRRTFCPNSVPIRAVNQQIVPTLVAFCANSVPIRAVNQQIVQDFINNSVIP
jgi:hypothetical protein